LRRKHRALFAKGNYVPLRAMGTKHKSVIAFARSFRGATVIVMAGRFFAQLGAQSRFPVGAETWGDTQVILRKRISAGPYRDVLTGQTVSSVARDGDPALPVSKAFSHLPAALLIHVEEPANAG
jgi:(1->4)-alpha-D-glucan 1-alpha-D-glucosylmutase